MIRKAILLFHTVKYLKFKQVYFRAYYRIKKIKSSVGGLEKESIFLGEYQWLGIPYAPQSLFDNDNAIFLHEEYSVKGSGIWNDKVKSKLWLYNLHYLGDLNSLNADERFEFHLSYVLRWIDENPPGFGNGWEPYPSSLRVINWIKWSLLNEDLKSENQHAREVLSFENGIVFKNVSFRYPQDSPMILNAVSLEIKKMRQ
jgi:ABC-type multidrug transport system fused ATPase/permease subunit